jgi:hypothetical protein
MIILPTYRGALTPAPTGGAPFSPSSTSPSIWLDASTTAYCYTLDTGGSVVTDGQAVGRIEDRSGNLRHYSQSVAARRPVYRANRYNSYGCLEFTRASNHWLDSVAAQSVLNNAAGATAMLAMRYKALQASYTNTLWFSGNSNVGSSRLAVGTGATGTTQQHFVCRRADSPAGTFTNLITGSTSFQTESFAVNHTTALFNRYINGTAVSVNVATGLGTGTYPNLSSARASIGTHDTSSFADVDLCELILWNRVLSSTELSDMHSWFNTKYTPS